MQKTFNGKRYTIVDTSSSKPTKKKMDWYKEHYGWKYFRRFYHHKVWAIYARK